MKGEKGCVKIKEALDQARMYAIREEIKRKDWEDRDRDKEWSWERGLGFIGMTMRRENGGAPRTNTCNHEEWARKKVTIRVRYSTKTGNTLLSLSRYALLSSSITSFALPLLLRLTTSLPSSRLCATAAADAGGDARQFPSPPATAHTHLV